MEQISKNLIQILILTKNEAPNIRRVLDRLTDFERIVVLDSYSTDETIDYLKLYKNVEIQNRKFDTFATQCNYGLSLLDSEWILSLDADYVLSPDFINETKNIISEPNSKYVAYYAKFDFLIFGKKLIGNNTTPRAVLFKTGKGTYFDDGHAHRLEIHGQASKYKATIQHDDRKSFSRWLANQDGYAQKESYKLLDLNNPLRNSVLNRIRRTKIFAPFFVFFYCVFVKGLFLSGWAGWYYILQRTMVEILLALRLIEEENLNN